MINIAQKRAYLLLFAFFLLVYIFSLTFVYVEGDDASTIAYHALGRDIALQEPYSPYHGMMDQILRIFPANESLLRIVSILISSLAAFTYVLLLSKIVYEWLPDGVKKPYWLFVPLIPLFIPEFLFFGLIYMTSPLAMSLILLGHLLTRKAFLNPQKHIPVLIVGALLFGLGSSFRWDVAVYGIVVFADLFFIAIKRQHWLKHLIYASIWSVLVILSVLLFIYISGYSPGDIIDTIRWAKAYVSDKTFNPLKSFAGALSLFTPAAGLAALIGLFHLIVKRNWPLLILSVVGFLPKLYLGFSLLPKGLVMAIPGYLLLIAIGFGVTVGWLKQTAASYKSSGLSLIAACSVVILIPWLVGLHVSGRPLTWGPGFEKHFESHSRYSGATEQQVTPKLSGGFAIPTPEGPRPVWGYAYVLPGGGWRNFMKALDKEREDVISYARNNNLPILQENEHKFLLNKFLEDGWTEPEPQFEHQHYKVRTLVKDDLRQQIYIYKSRTLLNEQNLSESIIENGHTKFVCWFIESSLLFEFGDMPSVSSELKGPNSAVVTLQPVNR